MARTARVVGARFDGKLAELGLTSGQFTILMTLARLGPLPIGRLADELSLDPTTVPRVMRPLQRRDWVQLSRGQDRRVRLATITDAGLGKLTEALPTWERLQSEAIGMLQATSWDELRRGIAALRRGLRRPNTATPVAASGRV